MRDNARVRFFVNPLHVHQRQTEGYCSHNAWAPPTDVYETKKALVVKMALPGVRVGDVRIRFAPGVIAIFGHRDFQKDTEILTYHRMEIRSGRFERRIKVQLPLDPENTTARYDDGFLTIWIPRSNTHLQEVYTVKLML